MVTENGAGLYRGEPALIAGAHFSHLIPINILLG